MTQSTYTKLFQIKKQMRDNMLRQVYYQVNRSICHRLQHQLLNKVYLKMNIQYSSILNNVYHQLRNKTLWSLDS